MRKKALLLLSGGIDSATLLAKLYDEKYETYALSFNYGQKHSVELDYAIQLGKDYALKEHIILDLPNESFISSALINKELKPNEFNTVDDLVSGFVNSYVPFRNMIFLSFALSIAESNNIDQIFVGFNKDDSINYWDCKENFINHINIISGLNTTIKIKSPFINLSKKEVVLLGKSLGVDYDNTISCYQPIGNVECGCCLSCVIKKEAFNE